MPLLFLVLTLTPYLIQAQQLNNTSWVRFKSERIDGSQIVDRNWKDAAFHLVFHEKTVEMSYGSVNEFFYTVSGRILTLDAGKPDRNPDSDYDDMSQAQFDIDSISSTLLVLRQQPKEKEPAEKTNRFYFVKEQYYFPFLLNQKKVEIVNDTIIECNRLIFPFCKKNLDSEISHQIKDVKENDEAKGFIIFSPKGKIEKIQVGKFKSASDDIVQSVIAGIRSTEGDWVMPVTGKKFYFKLNFSINLMYWYWRLEGGMLKARFKYNNGNSEGLPPALAPKLQERVDKHFNAGVRYASKEKYLQAVDEFRECIKIDSLHVDAYYNLAYSYQKMKKMEDACNAWKYLADLKQVRAMKLREQLCK